MIKDKIRVLIVDDESESRRILRMLLSELKYVRVLGEADGVEGAKKLLLKEVPDVMLLDIQMPGKSGFDLIHEITNLNLHVNYIFVTAFDEYAIKAIKASAFDYLLKPVGLPEIDEALTRFRFSEAKKRKDGDLDLLFRHFRTHQNIKFNTRSGYILIDPMEILLCKADGNYTIIHLTTGKKELITCRIGEIQNRLHRDSFFRISRSALINLRFLYRVDTKARTCYLKNWEQPLAVSRSMLKDLELCSIAQSSY